jgi:serine/threonine protein kinase
VSDPLIGVALDQFRIDARLGAGGMGIVYRATDLALKREVAVKVLAAYLLDDAVARARFQREIESAVAIEHPHVVPVYAAGLANGRFYLVMRCIKGPDLGRLVADGGPLAEARAMRLVGQIASALDAMHVQGLVHRDVKPPNVLVWNADASDEHCFLTDFGIAKAMNETHGITKFGVLGTLGYMAPEIRDGKSATPACDQFSLACLAYELLSGRLPFETETLEQVDAPPIPLGLVAPTVSKRTRDTIERALAPDPSARFPSLRAFVEQAEAAHESFERSTAITQSVRMTRSEAELVDQLHAEHGLTDEAIAEIADLKKSQVLQLRRRAARDALVGASRPRGRDASTPNER